MKRLLILLVLVGLKAHAAELVQDLGSWGLDKCAAEDRFYQFATTVQSSLAREGQARLDLECRPGGWSGSGFYHRHFLKFTLHYELPAGTCRMRAGKVKDDFFYQSSGHTQNFYWFDRISENAFIDSGYQFWFTANPFPDDNQPGYCGDCDHQYFYIEEKSCR